MKFKLPYFIWGLITTLVIGLCSCTLGNSQPTLVVAIAASLTDVMAEIRAEFQAQHPDISIQFNTAASGTLQRQIEQQAPIDIFASAALEPVESLAQKGFVETEAIRIFAKNQLVLIQNQQSQPQLNHLEDLADEDVPKVALGNPKTVPAGKYAANLLEKYPQLYETLEQSQKLVFGENVRQVLTYVQNQSVTAGFVYQTDIFQQSNLRVIESFSPELTDSILYAIAPIKTSLHQSQGQLFIDFILGQQSQAILQKYGFLSPRD
ncbi:molybdate ABC transporter substrate-binding protein [Picosynechococcus sp. PCC 7003]|uniref:molybdate ABC transporter substrate-binding protein n=1 Tax=Picosynechococcus sp. PCC 7003 TaxID=374981 RepID=UPI000810AA3E|nr:molybdate ABC transporter substrate-binding protein [Picosynechococcus sp. PCC 7003]ANV84139.1 molybdate ABC transporter substrate-binding protein [Picosynechococcus sp. PCC 7003]